MREIKFRGKREDNGEWVFGDLHHGLITGNIYIMGTQVISETVGQYTGLKDKNDVEIYEGDVLHFTCKHSETDWHGVVKFGNPNGEYNWGWQLVPMNNAIVVPDILLWVEVEETGAWCEVIGNIHDGGEK